MRKMRILALVPSVYDTSPGQRFRIEQWDPMLAGYNIKVDHEAFESEELHEVLYKPRRYMEKVRLVGRSLARRRLVLKRVREYDVVYVFREAALLGPPIFESMIGKSGVPMVFDFDDSVFLSYLAGANRYFTYLKLAPSKTRTACRLASHVIAGNSYLAEYAERYNQRVTVIPTTIDTLKYKPAGFRGSSDTPVVGWSGSHSTVAHLNTIRDALSLLAQRERFRLQVIGTPNYEIPGVDVTSIAWRAESEVEELRKMDIGIMPLPDDPWCRGKCGLKALQYMALGIPTIVSPVGVNVEIIRDGENGFLASTDDEWVRKLSLLVNSPELRKRIGEAGRKTVEVRYSAEAQVPRFVEVLRSVTNSKLREYSS